MAWISKDVSQFGSMSLTEMQNNAYEQYPQLLGYGWTLNAIAGLMGNEQRESYFNPGQWQGEGNVGNLSVGYGLVQWTPASKIMPFLSDRLSGVEQTERINDLTANDWIIVSGYNLTYDQFKASKESPEYLALVFAYNYERAGTVAPDERQRNARYWYEWLGGQPKPPDPPDPPIGGRKSKWIYYLKRL